MLKRSFSTTIVSNNYLYVKNIAMKKTIRLTEQGLHRLIKECIHNMLKEDADRITYNGEGENSEEWFEAGLTPYDVSLIPDEEIAEYHNSREGYTILYDDEEFGEAWREGSLYIANSNHDVFGGYLRVFQAYTIDGLIEEIMDAITGAILNGTDEEDY